MAYSSYCKYSDMRESEHLSIISCHWETLNKDVTERLSSGKVSSAPIKTVRRSGTKYFHLPSSVTTPLLTISYMITLRKHAYSNILKILQSKTENFQMKNSEIFHISAENIDCGYSLEPPRRGGSNEYPQSMFLAEIRKNNIYPCKPQFYYIILTSTHNLCFE